MFVTYWSGHDSLFVSIASAALGLVSLEWADLGELKVVVPLKVLQVTYWLLSEELTCTGTENVKVLLCFQTVGVGWGFKIHFFSSSVTLRIVCKPTAIDFWYFHKVAHNWNQLETFAMLSLRGYSRWSKMGCFVRGMKGDRGELPSTWGNDKI